MSQVEFEIRVFVGHMANAALVGIETGEQRGAGGTAPAVVVELGEAEAVRGEFVEIGGVDFAAVTADVREAHVVGHDEDDVGAFRPGGVRCMGRRCGQGEGGEGGACVF